MGGVKNIERLDALYLRDNKSRYCWWASIYSICAATSAVLATSSYM